MTEKRNKIVFETSDIFNVASVAHGRKVWEDKSTTLYSTTLLELALSEGMEVYVASTRRFLRDSDNWWVDLMRLSGFGYDHIFFCDCKEDDEHDSNGGWKRLFKHLNIEWPAAHEDLPNEPAHWTSARHELEEHGILLAQTVLSEFRRAAMKTSPKKGLEQYKQWRRLHRKMESIQAVKDMMRACPTVRGAAGGAYGAYTAARKRKEKQA